MDKEKLLVLLNDILKCGISAECSDPLCKCDGNDDAKSLTIRITDAVAELTKNV